MAHKIENRVRETTTTTGTGPLTTTGAVAGNRTFASKCSVGDTVRYCIEDSATGDWEVGIGTYSAANELTRTTVFDSSNAGAAVSFAAGTKEVWINFDATMAGWIREKLTADTTFYVATTGNDANDGKTIGSPFLTLQGAMNYLARSIDANGYVPKIKLANGTYTSGLTVAPVPGMATLTVEGDTATPANVVISTTSANCFTIRGTGLTLNLQGMKLQTTTSGSCVSASIGANVQLTGLMDFGSCAGNHVAVDRSAVFGVAANYTISGGAQNHWSVRSGGYLSSSSRTVTLTGTPAFSSAFALAYINANIELGSNTFSGSATGKRFDCSYHGIIVTYGAGDTHLPGSVSGTQTNGGAYF